MVEVEEWVHVNKELRHHGFPLIELVNPGQIEDLSDLVLLRSETARTLRMTLITLMKDCDRRQELVQELIMTNTQLREELKTQSLISEKYENKTKYLQSLLDDSKLKLQELEEEKWNLSVISKDEGERLRNTKDAAAARSNHLAHKCDLYKQEVERLQSKLKQINIEEEKRKKKQAEVLKQMRRKWAKGGAANDHMLTVIDWYETQIAQLKQEVTLTHLDGTTTTSCDSSNHDNNTSRSSVNSTAIGGATSNYKALVKSYERQLRDSKKATKTLENETELLKLELQSRPHINDLRDAQARVKKLERILKIHGINPSLVAEKKSKLLFSTKVDDIEFLPASQCRHYLKTICQELDVEDVEKIQSKVQQLVMDSEALPHLKEFSEAVIDAVKPKLRGQQGLTHAIWCEKTKHQVIMTLQEWSLQIDANQELQLSIHRLAALLFPWKRLNNVENPTTTDMIQQIDSLLQDEDEQEECYSHEHSQKRRTEENPPKSMLLEIVSHFQMLFDVPSIKGVYVCMSDLYKKLGEVNNIVKTLKDLLDLEADCKVSAIVEAVAELRNVHHQVTVNHVSHVIGTDDLESVRQKLQEHEAFFPIFHELLQRIMEMLNVNRTDEVLPAIRALKLLAAG